MLDHPRILIVDDEPRMRESLDILLSNEGYATQAAQCGQEAIEILSHHEYDVALVDMVMPDMTGPQLMDHIKTLHPKTFIIAITGHASLDSALGALRKGAYDYLKKPFEHEELINTIQNALNQVRLTREKQTMREQLNVSQERFEYLVQNSPDIIYMLDNQGKFSFVSKTVERLLGLKADHVIGNHYSVLIYGRDMEKAKFAFNERRTGPRASTGVEVRLKSHLNGHRQPTSANGYLTFELKSTGVYGKTSSQREKKFLGTYGVARDISARKKLEAKLLQAQKMEAIGTLAGGIAHDFNNILMAIIGYAELALNRAEPASALSKYIDNVLTAGQRGKALVQQILAFSRQPEEGRRPLQASLFVKEALKLLRASLPTTIDIHQDLRSRSMVMGNPIHLQQIVMNLCTNAAHAMQSRAGKLRVQLVDTEIENRASGSLSHLKPGLYIRLSVNDSGCGMSPDVASQIFDPYFTTKKKGEGTGLGLSVVHGIVSSYKGEVTVQSEPGKGSTFNVYLPRMAHAEQAAPEPGESFCEGREHILYIDDEHTLAEMGREILETCGYFVTSMTNSINALELFRSSPQQFDLVVTDMTMPDMTGDQLAQAMLQIRPDIPIILCTGYSHHISQKQARSMGIRAYVTKPVSMKEMARIVRNILNGQQE